MINAKDVKKLRDMTGAGMMDCKRALEETSGDIEKAVDLLRAKGAAKAAKWSEKSANEGTIGSYVHFNGKVAYAGIFQPVGAALPFPGDDLEHGTVLSANEVVAGVLEIYTKFQVIDVPLRQRTRVRRSNRRVFQTFEHYTGLYQSER